MSTKEHIENLLEQVENQELIDLNKAFENQLNELRREGYNLDVDVPSPWMQGFQIGFELGKMKNK